MPGLTGEIMYMSAQKSSGTSGWQGPQAFPIEALSPVVPGSANPLPTLPSFTPKVLVSGQVASLATGIINVSRIFTFPIICLRFLWQKYCKCKAVVWLGGRGP